MATINIPSTVDDPNYRYKMPAVKCKVEGSGNGIKTNHMNMRDVATALKRNPEYITKFLACELSTHGRYFDNEGKAIFQGVHAADAFTTKLDMFINSYVLCPSCHLPEIDLFVENKLVMGKCNACGSNSKVNNIHRVAAYIIKNPPVGSTVGGQKSKAEKKAEKKADKTGGADKGPTDNKAVDEAPKKKIVRKKVIKKVVKKKTDANNAFDIVSETANTIMVRMHAKATEENVTPSEFFQEFRTIQLTQALTNADRFYLALGALYNVGRDLAEDETFDGQFNRKSIEDFKQHMPFLKILGYDCPEDVILGVQNFMWNCATESSFKTHYPLLLKAFYDENIVDDEDVIQFYEAEKKLESYMSARRTLQPLIKWLEDAGTSYESSEESSDDAPQQMTKKLT